MSCRYEDVTREECQTVQDQECRVTTEPSCENRQDEECRDVPSIKMENQCTTTQEEKCINTTSHKFVTQEKVLVERICSEVPDQECQIQTVVEVILDNLFLHLNPSSFSGNQIALWI